MSDVLHNMHTRPTVIKVGDKYVGSKSFYVQDTPLVDSTNDHQFNGMTDAYRYKLKMVDHFDESELDCHFVS